MINRQSWRISYKSLLIIWYFSYNLIYPIVSSLTNTRLSQSFYDAGLLLLLLFVSKYDKRAIKRDAVIVWGMVLVAMAFTLFLSPEYKAVLMGDQFNFVKSVLSLNGPLMGYTVIRTENDSKKLLFDLKVSAVIVWIAFTMRTLNGVADVRYASFSNATVILNYNQSYGFWFLFSLCIMLFCYLTEKKLKYLVFVLICAWQILMYASRTAIISLAVYVVLYLFVERADKNLKKKILYATLLMVAVILLTSNSFLTAVKSVITNMGLSSKIIDAFISGNNELDGGREYLYISGWEYIKNNPFGLGIFSDRYLLGHYVHNFFIELFMDFGWFIGGFVVLYLSIGFARVFCAEKSTDKSLFIIFFSLWIARLMLSYSFWQDTNFWISIAIMKNWREFMKRKHIADNI